MKSRLNFKYFEKKDDARTFCISTCQILRLLVNTFPIDENYPLLKRDNLTIPIKVQLSQKQKTFSEFFIASSNSTWNFQNFEQKDDPNKFFD